VTSLAIDGVSAGYGGTDVLRGVSVSVSPGQCVAVLGPNGAGKSTLLRVLSGQLRIRGGTRTIAGKEVRSWSAHQAARAGVRWVGEPRPIFPGLSVAENLELGGILVRNQIAEQRDRVYELMPALYEKRAHRAASLSGGQQQMLGLGQALMSKPRFLCLDEPSLGLSPAMVSVMTQLITGLVEEGVGIVWAEQFPEVARAHCTELIVLSAGLVAVSGDPHTVTTDALSAAYLGGDGSNGSVGS
jgi:branched-chain amino acid transport system ATP-binding protein